MKIVAFAASSSSSSINKHLVRYAVSILDEIDSEVLDLNDYELPLYSSDQEALLGQPEQAKQFLQKIEQSDAMIISFAEHNGNYSAAYKNLFDWCSRIKPKVYDGKPMVLLSTSPGARGGASVLALAEKSMPYFGGIVKSCCALPNFNENFDAQKGVVSNNEWQDKIITAVSTLK